MVEVFNEKIIISGKYIEQYQYLDVPILKGYKRKKRIKTETEEIENNQKEKTAYSVNRTRTEIRRLTNANPQLSKFLTLTFSNEMTDLTISNRLFNAYIRKMNNQFPEFQYLAIPEFQKDIDYFGNLKEKGGSVHYHLLCNLRYVQSQALAEIWKHGFIKIKRIDRISNIGAYVCKYLQKEMFDKRMFRKKKFFCSQNLTRPAEITGKSAKFFYEEAKENMKLLCEKEFENEYRGKVVYKQYELIN